MTGAGGGSTLGSGFGKGSDFETGSSLRDCCPNSAMCRASLGLGAGLPDHRTPTPTRELLARACDGRRVLPTRARCSKAVKPHERPRRVRWIEASQPPCITVRGVNSVHGSGTADRQYGGPALGFMIHFENGLTVYFSGSTALTLDTQLWAQLYKPDVAILSLADRREAAGLPVKFLTPELGRVYELTK